MKFFDPHVHMNARTTDDYQAMAQAGIVAVCEPAFWIGQPRTSVGTYEDYICTIIGWERFRAAQFGIHHFCMIALNPREANNPKIADGVMALLPLYLHKEGVLGIGEIGFDDMTQSEEKYFRAQLQLAKDHNVPVIIHTPHRDKKRGTERSIALVKEVCIDQRKVLIDHNMEETLPIVLETSECWAGHTIYPHTKMSKERMLALIKKYGLQRMIVNSAADWGVSDPLNVPKTAELMMSQGFTEQQCQKLFWDNPVEFFRQSHNFCDINERPVIDQTQKWEGNSVLRGGQQPYIERK